MTREEELIRIAKKLEKMVSRNNTEGAMDLLNELKSFNMTLKLLQETRIGMSVNSIRKHCTDEDVIAMAKVLIKEWKKLLDSSRPQMEKAAEEKNGLDSSKAEGSPNDSPRRGVLDSSVLYPTRFPSPPRPARPPLPIRRPSVNMKKERKDSLDSKVAKKQSMDVKKERKNSLDSKLSQPVKHQTTPTKPERRESDSKHNSLSPRAKKLTSERRESHGSKATQSGPPQRKPSTDHNERKGKTEAPKTPTAPSSPLSPGFASTGGSLPPHLITGDSIRDKCIEMLAAALRTDNDYKDFGTNCDSMAAEIEDHIYQEIKATDMKYKNRVRSRISNLKDPKNPGLRRNVLAGSIDLSRIAIMSAEEMASDELKQLRNVLTQEAIREHQMAKTGGTTTDLLQCGKCKKKNCTYNQVQTRSADEPMTTFVLCNECGNRWKFC
ncbi:transcription elongation factor A protein 3 isoform X4 [Syngnathus typhle]|uniref:transcription elongation factor A protein 3 isoform X4 n=1 Tax=Syngnathus typhle TaxID=161592 RepID=UPI002A69D223|nr:transcription elongation factor A protein 3 isoform X4 [Syngnathus typhle]